MARPRIFSPDTVQEIAKRAAAGESTGSIARSLGTSPQNVQNALKRGRDGAGTLLEGVGTPDAFEAQQLDVLRRIDEALDHPRIGAVGVAALVKAKNDTIKAIRQHRVLSKAGGEDPDALGAVADQVLTRLQRLAERSAGVGAVLAPVPAAPEDEERNGTE